MSLYTFAVLSNINDIVPIIFLIVALLSIALFLVSDEFERTTLHVCIIILAVTWLLILAASILIPSTEQLQLILGT